MLGGEHVGESADGGQAARAGAEQLLAGAEAWRAARPSARPTGVAGRA
jgi:hypothetical protein